jgi:ribonuclease VapC
VSSSVLDASALMALLKQETGYEQVAALIRSGAVMSAVNLSEVIAKLDEAGVPVASIRTTLDGFKLELIPFDADAAYAAGQLRAQTKGAGLSFGDRACIALAEARALPIATADRMWANLSLAVPVNFIR